MSSTALLTGPGDAFVPFFATMNTVSSAPVMLNATQRVVILGFEKPSSAGQEKAYYYIESSGVPAGETVARRIRGYIPRDSCQCNNGTCEAAELLYSSRDVRLMEKTKVFPAPEDTYPNYGAVSPEGGDELVRLLVTDGAWAYIEFNYTLNNSPYKGRRKRGYIPKSFVVIE